MKHKFFFLLPRLAGLTLLIGLASLVLFLLFKLMLLIIVAGVVIAIAGKIISQVRKKGFAGNNLAWTQPYHFDRLNRNEALQPARNSHPRVKPAIIPIH